MYIFLHFTAHKLLMVMVMTHLPALQIWNFLMKNRKSLNSGLMLALCLIMKLLAAYYTQNYAGII